MIEIAVKTSGRREAIDITKRVEDAVYNAGVDEGLCVVYVPHTTAGITITEHADPSVIHDVLSGLIKSIPALQWTHLEGNSDAHFLSSLVGSHVAIPISGGKLHLGTWQGIFFMEFDGPRQRKVYVQILESARRQQ
ncbi:YjbQ family protein [Coprothermobacteraceae bacterium]|nr:YjbQ family protein [Coprothermobacteraceae bacterium]